MKSFTRKAFALFLCLMLLFPSALSAVPQAAAYDIDPYRGLTGKTSWSIDENGKLTVSGTGPIEYRVKDSRYEYKCSPLWESRLSDITSAVIEPGITEISDSAFYNCINLKSISIPDTVTSVSYDAFRSCTALTSVFIPSGVEEINSTAFDGCTGLKEITVDPANTAYSSDESGVLFNKDKTELILFPAASETKEYSVPSTVRTIADYAFYSCTGLKSVTVPNGVNNIGISAFQDCSSLESISLPDSVAELATCAFCGCSALAEFAVPAETAYVPNYLLMNCTSLKKVTIPSGVSSISSGAFINCKSLETITVGNANEKFSDNNGVLFNKGQTSLICYPAGKTEPGYVVPETVTSIGIHAFAGCEELRFVHIPSTVTSIPSYSTENAFAGCEPDFICSDSENCAAKAFADASGIDFVLCSGGDHTDDFTLVTLSLNNGADIVLRAGEPDSAVISVKADGIAADPADFTWKSSNGDVASIGPDGTVTAVHCGEAVITASGEKCRDASVKVTVSHLYSSETVDPTCSEGGYTSFTCSDCGDSYNALQTAPLGHSFVDGVCERCNEKTDERILSEAKETALEALEELSASARSDEAKAIIGNAREAVNSAESADEAQAAAVRAAADAAKADNDLDSAKEKRTAALEELLGGAVSDSARAILTEALNAINDASSLEEVERINSKAFADASADERVLEYAKENAASELNEQKSTFTSEDAKEIINTAVEAINAASGTKEVEQQQKNAASLARQAEEEFILAKDNAVTELNALASTSLSDEAKEIAENALDAVKKAVRTSEVNDITAKAAADAAAADDCGISGHRYVNGACRVCGHVQYWDYTINDGRAVITGYTGNEFELRIPAELQGAKVVGVAASAFENNGNLFYVYVPDSVTYVEENAFRSCAILSEVCFGSGISRIEKGAFADCSMLTIVCINSGSTAVDPAAFTGNDKRLTFAAPAGSSTAKTLKNLGADCIEYEYPVMRKESPVISFSGKTVLWRDLDYNYWTELVKLFPDAVYLRFDSLEIEGIAPDAAGDSFDSEHFDPDAENLTLKNIYISIKIDGETITFDKLTEMLKNGYSELVLTFDDDSGGSLSLLQRISDGLMKVFHALTKIINAVIRVFKK